MMTFFCKLHAPRATFGQDMTAAEMKIMQDHGIYWREWLERGKVVTLGVVADPSGVFGIGVLEVDDEAEVERLTHDDPAIRADAGFSYEIHLMPRGAMHR
jgi:hypothetical protein